MPVRRAIVIEDTDADRDLVVALLRVAGLTDIVDYAHFPEGFDTRIDDDCLIVVDLVLGAGVDGVEALQRLAAADVHQAPIVIVSGQLASLLGVVENYGQALGLNIVATIAKPIPVDSFVSVLKQLANQQGC